MKKYLNILILSAFIAAGASAFAKDDATPAGHPDDMKAMGANSDGMISKFEFMKYHEEKSDK